MPLLLTTPLSPREAWETLNTAIANDTAQVACAPLLVWLRVAITAAGAGQASILRTPHPTAPIVDADLHCSRWSIVERDLPALSSTAPTVGAREIAQAIGGLVTEQRTTRLAENDRRNTQRTQRPEVFFGENLTRIQRLCRVTQVTDLPPLWAQIAQVEHRLHLTTLQRAVDSAREALALENLPTVMTPAHLRKITTVQLVMSDREDLTTGWQPFVFQQNTPQFQATLLHLADMYNMVNAGQGAPGLADAEAIMNPGPNIYPVTFAQTRHTIQRTIASTHPLLYRNEAHPHDLLVNAIDFVDLFTQREAVLEQTAPRMGHDRSMMPALILRWFQLRWSLWFVKQWNSATPVPAPHFTDLFEQMDVDAPWEPTFPHGFLPAPRIAPRAPPQAPPALPALQPAPQQQQPAPAPAPAPVPAPAPAPPTRPTGNRRVNNPSPVKQMFHTFRDIPNLRVRDVRLRATRPPPTSPFTHADGRQCPMCVAWHVKGMCNEGCGSTPDHQAHTDEQDAPLAAWCTEFYVVRS